MRIRIRSDAGGAHEDEDGFVRIAISSPVVTVSQRRRSRSGVGDERMPHADVNRIPIVRDGELVGIVARHDLFELMRGVRATTAVSAP